MAEKNRNLDGMRHVPGSRKTVGSRTESPGRKRDSRAGTRKVTSLTAEQLERKRANDREAQRTIRQRTKEHIENLEHQVAELSAKGEQMDRVIERNAALEAEIAHLRQQLVMLSNSRPLYRVDGNHHPPFFIFVLLSVNEPRSNPLLY
jgi:phage I-like protein